MMRAIIVPDIIMLRMITREDYEEAYNVKGSGAFGSRSGVGNQ